MSEAPRKGKEAVVAVVAIFGGPGITQELYEESIRKLTGGKSRVESPSDWPIPGLLIHIAGQGPSGFRVVDVWESEDAFERFGGVIGPILQDLGVTVQPEVYPAHTLVTA